MKKTFFILLVLTFIFISCDNEDMDEDVNPFVGTWEHENGELYVFTKTEITAYLPDNRIYYTGDYTYDDHNIYINVNIEQSIYTLDTIIYPYIISGNILYLMNIPLVKKNN